MPGRFPRPSRVPFLPSPVQRYVAERARGHKDEGNYELNEDDLEREEQAKVDAEEASRGDNKDELKKRMGPNQEKPTDKVRILPSTYLFCSLEPLGRRTRGSCRGNNVRLGGGGGKEATTMSSDAVARLARDVRVAASRRLLALSTTLMREPD